MGRFAGASSDHNRFYGRAALMRGRVFIVAPVCSNCGASDFVWVNELKTGSLGGGSLSIRARGELALGTRICRSCGHADLFLRDPAILRMPHTWRPGEFVPIPATAAPSHGHHPTPPPTHSSSAAPAPSPPPPLAPPPPPSPEPAMAAAPAPPAASEDARPAPVPDSGPAPESSAAMSADVATAPKKPARRRSSKPKPEDPPASP